MLEYIKKILRSGNIALIISNDEMKDILKTVKSLDDSGLLLEEVTEAIQNEVKKQNWRFLSMLLGTLLIRLLRSIIAGKWIIRVGVGAIAKSQERGAAKKRQEQGIVLIGELAMDLKDLQSKTSIFNAALSFN